MDKKLLFNSLISFAVTLLICASVIFAWITLQNEAGVDDFVLNVNDLKSEIELKVRRNDEDFVELKTVEDYNEMFKDALPSYRYLFNLSITNKSTRDSSIKVVLYNILSYNLEDQEDFDMREVFYIDNGMVSVNGVNQKQLRPIANNPDEVYDPYLFNLKDLLDSNNNIVILENYMLEVDEVVIIEFTIVYDQNTSAIEYQDGSLGISAIYIYNN